MSNVKRIIEIEKKMYMPDGSLFPKLIHSKDWAIFRWQRHLRLEEHYLNSKTMLGKIMFAYHKRLKNILGQKMGFDVPAGVFLEGLHIHHVGTVSINNRARVGKNCDIAGNLCLGGKCGGGPVLGDNVQIGWGVSIIGDVTISDGCLIGAGAVVTHSCDKHGAVLCGVPAREIHE